MQIQIESPVIRPDLSTGCAQHPTIQIHPPWDAIHTIKRLADNMRYRLYNIHCSYFLLLLSPLLSCRPQISQHLQLEDNQLLKWSPKQDPVL